MLSLGLLVKSKFKFIRDAFDSPMLVYPDKQCFICWTIHKVPYVAPVLPELCLCTEDAHGAQGKHPVKVCNVSYSRLQVQNVDITEEPAVIPAEYRTNSLLEKIIPQAKYSKNT